MKKLTWTTVLLCVSLVGLSGCLNRSEELRDNPDEYLEVIGTAYVTKTDFEIYSHPENLNKLSGPRYYSLYPSTESGHVNNRYSRLLGEVPKGARLKVVSVVQGVDSQKVAFVVKIEVSPDEIMEGEEAVIRAYTKTPSLYVQEEEAGLWGLSSCWFYKE